MERVVRGLRRRGTLGVNALRDRVLLPVAKASSWLASLYYFLFSGAFRREHAATIRGRAMYLAQEREAGRHDYLLRRNIHMLEKGLVMRPRRSVFALEYINATVMTYAAMHALYEREPGVVDRDQLQWAHDVLTTYFSIAGPHKTIDKVRAKFEAVPALPPVADDEAWAPYARDLNAPPPVAYDDLLALAYRRRSVRWFISRPVPRELIDRAIAVADLSPSACNRQPFEYRVFDDPGLIAQVAAIPKGTRGFAQGFPAFVVLVGRMRAFFSERDRHLIYIDGALGAMALMLALEAQGLSSCSINWADDAEQERAVTRLLGLADDERVVMCLALGYPDPEAMVPYSAKKPLDRIRRYNVT